MISVVTVNYNDSAGLAATLDSVRRCKDQGASIECIVIDGASTDGSVDVMRRFVDVIDIGISERDSGIYDAMNKGSVYASGCSILFLNSGDVFFPGFDLAEFQSKFRVGENMVLCRCIQVFCSDAYLRPSLSYSGVDVDRYGHQAVFVPKRVYKELSFDTDLAISADSKWKREAAKRSDVQVCEDVCSIFMLGGISNDPTARQVAILACQKNGFVPAIKGSVKLLVRLIVGRRILYRLLFWRKCDRLQWSEAGEIVKS